MKYLFIFMFQDSINWFGEMSVLEWLVLFGVALLLSAIPYFVYQAALRNHLQHNRKPSILRWFSVSLWATLCLLWCLLFFRQTPSWLVFGSGFAILIIISIVLFISGRKPSTT